MILLEDNRKESPRWEDYGHLKAVPTKILFHWYEKRDMSYSDAIELFYLGY